MLGCPFPLLACGGSRPRQGQAFPSPCGGLGERGCGPAARARKCPWGLGGRRLLFPSLARARAGQLLGGERSSLFPQSGAVTHGAHTFHSRRPRQAWPRVKAGPGAAAAEQVPTWAPATPLSRLPHAVGRAEGGGRAACLILRHPDTTMWSCFESQCVAHLGAE